MKIRKRHAQHKLRKAPKGAFLLGAKKGGGGSQATESPDSLHSISYARLLSLMSEGEIKGLADGLKSVYLDSTPLQNADGSMNFQRVSVDLRTGTQYQEHIPGFPASESTQSVNVELRYGTPFVRGFSNPELSAVRVTISIPGLQQVKKNNDITGASVSYNIEVATDGGPLQYVMTGTVTGKTTSTYTRTHRIDLPQATKGWQIRITRTTFNSASNKISDKTYIESVTEVIDAKLRYPNSALLGIRVDAAQFSSIPTVAADLYGRIIAVPGNYNPDTRQYDGIWDGTFKQAWTDNPAWVFYDLITNGRYGLGARIDPGAVDRFALYRIGQYCDEMVSDGKGGHEPRFTCNVYLQTQADAYRVLSDLASVFRGIVYWGAGWAVPVADMPKNADYSFTAANVVDGKFSYTGSARATRYTVALVSWNDPTDMYRQKVEVVENQDGIIRYGVNKTEVTAFGCTSQAQAQRIGQWLTLTSCMETRTVTFSVGVDGAIPAPGSIIKVADPDLAGRRIGGRIHAVKGNTIELDGVLDIRPGDRLTVNLPSGKSETRDVLASRAQGLTVDSDQITVDSTETSADMTGLPGAATTVTVSTPFSEVPEPQAIWILESEELAAQTFRVLSVTENADNTYTISAVQNVMGKYDAIDHISRIEEPPVTIIPPRVQPAPANVRLSNYSVIDQGTERINVRIEWDAAPPANSYEAQWRRDYSDWVPMPRTGTTSAEITNAYAGQYEARVRAFNSIGAVSVWTSSTLTELGGTLGKPPQVAYLKAQSAVFGVNVLWGFPQGPNIIERTELWYSHVNDLRQAVKLGDYAYPQSKYSHMGMAANRTLYFWVRLVDRNGTAGAFYPDGPGVAGTSSNTIGNYLDYFAGQIGETQLGQRLTQKIDTAAAAAVQVQEVTTDLAAMWTVKTQLTADGKHYLAGIGVGVENNAGVIQSQVLVSADRFAILNLDDDKITTPFVIENGQTFINEAIIGKLSAEHVQVKKLSELAQDAGIIVTGKMQSATNGNMIDLGATGNQQAINFGNGAMTVTADGQMTINAVNVLGTLQLRAGAVTDVIDGTNGGFYWEGRVNKTMEKGAIFDLVVIAQNFPEGSRIITTGGVNGRIETDAQYDMPDAAFQILRDGVVLQTLTYFNPLPRSPVGFVLNMQFGSAPIVDRPAAGFHTYTLRLYVWSANGGNRPKAMVSVANATMVLQNAKR